MGQITEDTTGGGGTFRISSWIRPQSNVCTVSYATMSLQWVLEGYTATHLDYSLQIKSRGDRDKKGQSRPTYDISIFVPTLLLITHEYTCSSSVFYIHYSNQSSCHVILLEYTGKGRDVLAFLSWSASTLTCTEFGENKCLHRVCKSNVRNMALI